MPKSIIGPEVLAALTARAANTPPGAFVEVGVYQGGSACALYEVAQCQRRALYLYDTFSGMPWKADIDSHLIGDFADCDADSVRAACPHAIVVPGVFPQSAVPMPPIAFVHLDCDQYQSYHESIDYLAPLMVPGGVMWFDDLSLAGALKAATECFGDRIEEAGGRHYVQM